MSERLRVRTADDVAPTATVDVSSLADIVAVARRRLARIEIQEAILRHAALLCAVAGVCAASRPLVWSLQDAALWKAALRAVILALAGTAVVLGIIVVHAWRRRPSTLASARALDRALDLAEVIASGFAFERDGRNDEMASYAIERARRASAGIDVDRLLVPTERVRSTSKRRWLAAAATAAVIGLSIGAIDRVLVERTIHPVTARESTAASELKKAAERAAANLPHDLDDPKHPKAEEMLEAARRASEAAQRGDRRRAQEALDELRKAARALEADEREQARSLRAIRDEIEGAPSVAKGADDGAGNDGTRPGRPSATASEALAKLKKELEAAGGDEEAVRKLLERLERAEAAARSAAEKTEGAGAQKADTKGSAGKEGSKGEDTREGAWSRAAAALKEAREAAARGDHEAAKRAMERAEREIRSLEKGSSSPSKARAMARLADGASELDRSMYAAMNGDPSSRPSGNDGQDGKDGAGEGDSKRSSRGTDEPSGTPGSGPGAGDRVHGPEQRRVKISGDLQARTDVREGERAVSVLEGMGRGGDPKAYAEIFPSYDTVVEDGLREETVPAARRPVVRRYFSSIRPGGDEQESRKR